MVTHQAQLRFDAQARRGAGARWHARQTQLLRVEIDGHLLHRFDPATGPDGGFGVGDYIGSVVWWEGGRVLHIDPQRGERVTEVRVPVSQVTACAFGRPQLDQLLIAAARPQPTERLAQEPPAGGTSGTQPGARGVPAFSFGG